MSDHTEVAKPLPSGSSSLTAENVEHLFTECLSNTGEFIRGWQHSSPLNVTGREAEIAAMLAELPDQFKSTEGHHGGGWTFLFLSFRSDGMEWSSDHMVMDKLAMLGIAAGLAKWVLPREAWKHLPGGVPYFVILP